MLYTRGVGQQRSCWLALANAVDATPEICHAVLGWGWGWGWVGGWGNTFMLTFQRGWCYARDFPEPHDIPKHSFGAIKPYANNKKRWKYQGPWNTMLQTCLALWWNNDVFKTQIGSYACGSHHLCFKSLWQLHTSHQLLGCQSAIDIQDQDLLIWAHQPPQLRLDQQLRG